MDFLNFLKIFKAKLDGSLPGWHEQKKYLPLTPIKGVEYNSDEELKKGAVLTCLYFHRGDLMTILIERTKDTSPHSGQIAFPGGRFEKEDINQVNTALREAEEEIGINREKIQILGNLSPVEIPVSGFTVLPVIGYYEGIPELKANPHEVNATIQTPLMNLIESLQTQTIIVRGQKINAPVFYANGHIVWGATAMVLGELKALINQINKY